jgi:hypothetical protein
MDVYTGNTEVYTIEIDSNRDFRRLKIFYDISVFKLGLGPACKPGALYTTLHFVYNLHVAQ